MALDVGLDLTSGGNTIFDDAASTPIRQGTAPCGVGAPRAGAVGSTVPQPVLLFPTLALAVFFCASRASAQSPPYQNIHEGKHWTWYARQDQYRRHKAEIAVLCDYADKVFDRLCESWGLKPRRERYTLPVNARTGGGFAAGNIGEVRAITGQPSPGIGCAYDAFSNTANGTRSSSCSWPGQGHSWPPKRRLPRQPCANGSGATNAMRRFKASGRRSAHQPCAGSTLNLANRWTRFAAPECNFSPPGFPLCQRCIRLHKAGLDNLHPTLMLDNGILTWKGGRQRAGGNGFLTA
jgi:hypothetical protein